MPLPLRFIKSKFCWNVSTLSVDRQLGTQTGCKIISVVVRSEIVANSHCKMSPRAESESPDVGDESQKLNEIPELVIPFGTLVFATFAPLPF